MWANIGSAHVVISSLILLKMVEIALNHFLLIDERRAKMRCWNSTFKIKLGSSEIKGTMPVLPEIRFRMIAISGIPSICRFGGISEHFPGYATQWQGSFALRPENLLFFSHISSEDIRLPQILLPPNKSSNKTMPYYMFQYPITRPITLRHFKPTFLGLGVVFVTFITVVNVVAVGYENKPVISVAYNRTDTNWYEHLMGGFRKHWNCSASTIKVTEGFLAA